MDNKKRRLSVAISALFSVVNSTQNSLESFEKISEIIKIKFILKEVIKKREKMGKKSSEKKAKREFENFEKNKIEVIEKKESKEIHIQNIDSKKLSKYEKIKKFRDLENVSITYGDNEKDNFKDFQEIYILINNGIEEQNKKWIYSEKNKISYILPYGFLTTERIEGDYYSNYESNQKK